MTMTILTKYPLPPQPSGCCLSYSWRPTPLANSTRASATYASCQFCTCFSILDMSVLLFLTLGHFVLLSICFVKMIVPLWYFCSLANCDDFCEGLGVWYVTSRLCGIATSGLLVLVVWFVGWSFMNFKLFLFCANYLQIKKLITRTFIPIWHPYN